MLKVGYIGFIGLDYSKWWIGDRIKPLYRHATRMEQVTECLLAIQEEI
jgi:hypothetical protein